MIDILMPALSPTMEEGALAKWMVKVGDTVEAGQVIAEIETDKATMEVEAVDEGEVAELLIKAGTEGVKVNTPIARLKSDAASGAAPAPVAVQAGQPTPGASATDPRAVRDEARQTTLTGSAPPAPAHRGEHDATRPPPPPEGATADARVFASPLARRLAALKGVDVATLAGSGPRGRVIAADVEAAVAPAQGNTPAPPRDGEAGEPAPTPTSLAQLGIADGSYYLTPLDGMRRTIARRMTESFRDIPHFPLTIDLEIDRLLDARARINAALQTAGVKVSVNDMIVRAAAAALKAEPHANASYTPEGLALHHHADIAVAVAVDGGLVTPIVRRAETKSLSTIATEMKDLAERARTRRLKPEEFLGGTFSVSNLGMMGIKSFASILNPPQGCILSVGAGEKRSVVRGDALAIATVMTVTLTCDHRVVDGAIGARWLASFRGFVEDPVTLLA